MKTVSRADMLIEIMEAIEGGNTIKANRLTEIMGRELSRKKKRDDFDIKLSKDDKKLLMKL